MTDLWLVGIVYILSLAHYSVIYFNLVDSRAFNIKNSEDGYNSKDVNNNRDTRNVINSYRLQK